MSGNLHAVVLIALAISAALSAATDITCKGCLPLDEFNFENVVPRFKAVLVKFDVPYPYGEGHEEWRKFAEDVWGVDDDLLLAEVPVRFHGAKDNEGLAIKYGAKGKGDLPLVRLFVGDDPKKSYRLKDDLDVYGLKNLLRDKADVKIHLEGCLEEYDRIAADFIEDREEKLEAARRKAENSKAEEAASIETYLLYMEKIVEDGADFVRREKARLSKVIAKGRMAPEKKRELSRRLNILHSFVARGGEGRNNVMKQE